METERIDVDVEAFYTKTLALSRGETTPEAYLDLFKKLYTGKHAGTGYKLLKILLWSADNRSGLGTSVCLEAVLSTLCEGNMIRGTMRSNFLMALKRISRWDIIVKMLSCNIGSNFRITIFNYIHKALKDHNVACARYLPRNGAIVNRIRGYLKLSPFDWRKLVVSLCGNIIEVQMSLNKWSDIDYDKVPTHALVKYRKAFRRHDRERFKEYLRINQGRAIVINRILKNTIHPRPVLTFEEVMQLPYFDKPTRRFE